VSFIILKGKIQKYFSFRKYGFIETDESEDNIFFHISNFPSYEIPIVGQEVEFNVIETPKGKEAQEIKTTSSSQNKIEEKRERIPAVKKQLKDAPSSDLNHIPGIGPKYQLLLQAAHIKNMENLTQYAPEILMANLLAVNKEENITKRPPTLDNVENWIDFARTFRT